MRLHVMSDLHFEHYGDYGQSIVASLDPQGAEVCVLAGDVFGNLAAHSASAELRVKELCEKYSHVVFVPGNHEYYGSTREATEEILRNFEAKNPKFALLLNRSIVIGGHRLVGGTMWFPDQINNWNWEHRFSDFKQIKNLKDWCYAQNKAFRDYLATYLKEGDVVITHHLPTLRSVSTQFIGSNSNRFFVSQMDDLILALKPAVWIHGHTHIQLDYNLYDTRVVANPRGYPFEPTLADWNKSLFIELEDKKPASVV